MTEDDNKKEDSLQVEGAPKKKHMKKKSVGQSDKFAAFTAQLNGKLSLGKGPKLGGMGLRKTLGKGPSPSHKPPSGGPQKKLGKPTGPAGKGKPKGKPGSFKLPNGIVPPKIKKKPPTSNSGKHGKKNNTETNGNKKIVKRLSASSLVIDPTKLNPGALRKSGSQKGRRSISRNSEEPKKIKTKQDENISETKDNKETTGGEESEGAQLVVYYLKQAIEGKKIEMILELMAKAKASGLSKDHPQLIAAEKCLEGERETVQVYLKQGMQLRNKEILGQMYVKAVKLGVQTEDTKRAQAILQRIEAEHFCLNMLKMAVESKKKKSIKDALRQCEKEGLRTGQFPEIAKAQKMVGEKKGFGLFKKKPKKVKEEETFALFSGASLIECIDRSNIDGIPTCCAKCVEFLRAKALKQPGLFRVPGNRDNMEKMKKLFVEDKKVEFNEINDGAGVLKQWFRNLGEPLIPFSHYSQFLEVGKLINKKDPTTIEKFKELLANLPKENTQNLHFLLAFIKDVEQYNEINMMNAGNLAIVFAPNLLRPQVETPQTMIQETPVSISVVSHWIIKYDEIFGEYSKEKYA